MTETVENEKLGVNLRRFRKQRGFTMHTLALATQADKMTIMGIEKSEVNPSTNLVQKLAIALNVTVEDLVG
ncbi:MAG: transcriptional regulator with XRE-family HTH domain [Crocinitomix sp.]|jgi:transcriptional regulator with XRE-family HTH domain